ncbi:hypothetical protein B0H19DRAFT_125524 [Mycena capillaripes]|nr:hypothetical protein B0H19DRAFT_125524 [Mycena capillaripes]
MRPISCSVGTAGYDHLRKFAPASFFRVILLLVDSVALVLNGDEPRHTKSRDLDCCRSYWLGHPSGHPNMLQTTRTLPRYPISPGWKTVCVFLSSDAIPSGNSKLPIRFLCRSLELHKKRAHLSGKAVQSRVREPVASALEQPRMFEELPTMSEAVNSLLHVEHTIGHHDPYQIAVVRTPMTRNIGVCFPDIRNEVVAAFEDLVPAKTDVILNLDVSKTYRRLSARLRMDICTGHANHPSHRFESFQPVFHWTKMPRSRLH